MASPRVPKWTTRLRGKQKPKLPSAPLLPKRANGSRRCQYWDIRDGEQWQCGAAARLTAKVCSHHGAGTRKRVQDGTRKNPAASNLTNGLTASPALLAEITSAPSILALIEDTRAHPDQWLSGQAYVTRGIALIRNAIEKEDLTTGHGSMRGVDLIQGALGLIERGQKIEQARGPVTLEEVARYAGAVERAIDTFVDPEKRGAFRAFVDAINCGRGEAAGISYAEAEPG